MEVAHEVVVEVDSPTRAEEEVEAVHHAADSIKTGNSKEIVQEELIKMESHSMSRVKHNEFGHCNHISQFRFDGKMEK